MTLKANLKAAQAAFAAAKSAKLKTETNCMGAKTTLQIAHAGHALWAAERVVEEAEWAVDAAWEAINAAAGF